MHRAIAAKTSPKRRRNNSALKFSDCSLAFSALSAHSIGEQFASANRSIAHFVNGATLADLAEAALISHYQERIVEG